MLNVTRRFLNSHSRGKNDSIFCNSYAIVIFECWEEERCACSGASLLTFVFAVALDLQVGGGQAQIVGLLRGQIFGRLLLLYGVAHAEAAANGGHLSVELVPRDLVVEAQPAELYLHPEEATELKKKKRKFNLSTNCKTQKSNLIPLEA